MTYSQDKLRHYFSGSGKVPVILSLRFMAVIAVYLGHSGHELFAGHGSAFFIVLSGFVYSRILISGEFSSFKDHRNEFKRRILKLLPGLVCLMLLGVCYKLYSGIAVNWLQVLSVFTMTNNYFNAFFPIHENGFSHLWTLSLILQTYFFLSVLFYLLRKQKKIYLNSALGLCLFSSLIFRFIGWQMDFLPDHYIFSSFETRVEGALMGALLGVNFYSLRKYFKGTRLVAFFAILVSIIAILVGYFQGTEFRNGIGFSIQSIGYCSLLYLCWNFENLNLKKSFNTSVQKKRYGQIIYLFYLFHPWAISIGSKFKVSSYLQAFIGALVLILLILIFLNAGEHISINFNLKQSFFSLFKKRRPEVFARSSL